MAKINVGPNAATGEIDIGYTTIVGDQPVKVWYTKEEKEAFINSPTRIGNFEFTVYNPGSPNAKEIFNGKPWLKRTEFVVWLVNGLKTRYGQWTSLPEGEEKMRSGVFYNEIYNISQVIEKAAFNPEDMDMGEGQGTKRKRNNDGNVENEVRRKKSARKSNFQVALKAFVQALIQVMTTLGYSPMEMIIAQNVEAIVRVVSIADLPLPRQIKRGGQDSAVPDDVTVNKIKSDGKDGDGKVISVEANLNTIQAIIEQNKPKLDQYVIPGKSAQTRDSIWSVMMTAVLKSVGAPEEVFAPGVRRTRTSGLPAQTTVLGEGSRVPSRYSRHDRRQIGFLQDVLGLLSALKDTRSREGKPIWQIIVGNMASRCRDLRQRIILQAVNPGNSMEENKRLLSALLNTMIAVPPAIKRYFLPSMATLVAAVKEGVDIEHLDFSMNALEACNLHLKHKTYFGSSPAWNQAVQSLFNVAKILGNAFFSQTILQEMCPEAMNERALIQFRKCRLSMGDNYQVQVDKTRFLAVEVRGRGLSLNENAESWQISATNTFGNASSFRKNALLGLLTGQGKSSSRGNPTSALKAVMRDIRRADVSLTVDVMTLSDKTIRSVTLNEGGIFSGSFDGTEQAETQMEQYFDGLMESTFDDFM